VGSPGGAYYWRVSRKFQSSTKSIYLEIFTNTSISNYRSMFSKLIPFDLYPRFTHALDKSSTLVPTFRRYHWTIKI